jgi:hypothetical protein
MFEVNSYCIKTHTVKGISTVTNNYITHQYLKNGKYFERGVA